MGWQPKTTSALDSGTKQKTEGFEVRKNWVLFCGDLLFQLLISQSINDRSSFED